jgi:PAT family beta-lactamase induction signal transducer AmpG
VRREREPVEDERPGAPARERLRRAWSKRDLRALASAAWGAARAIDARLAAMLALGFASGLPLMMVFSKLSFWLREVGVDRTTIGGLYAVSLAYSLKVLWSPLVDRFTLPLLGPALGRRRSWMIVAIAGTVAGLVVIGASRPGENLLPTVLGALLLAYSGATLDIAVDAWRIESAESDRQANMAAVYVLGYRFAIMFSGLGLIIADAASWQVAYVVNAAAMAGVAGLVFFIREPPRADTGARAQSGWLEGVIRAVIDPFTQLWGRFGPWLAPVLGVVALYRLSDFTMGVMASPFYADLGYDKSTVGWISGLFGPWPVVLGGFLGGFFALRLRLLPSMMLGAALTLLTNGAFALLALAAGPGLDLAAAGVEGAAPRTPPTWALFVVVVGDNLAAGFVGSVFIAYLSSLADRRFAATQYALLSSAYSLFCKLMASTVSGPLSEAIGWAGFFTVTALFAVPSALLLAGIMAFGPEAARGGAPASKT